MPLKKKQTIIREKQLSDIPSIQLLSLITSYFPKTKLLTLKKTTYLNEYLIL